MKKNKIAVILVNYKDYAKRYLDDCCQSLRSQTLQDFDIFIVDNETSSESYSQIKKVALEARILRNSKNLGWAGGNNTAVIPNIDNYDYFVMLNMDTVLENNWLEELASFVKSGGDIIQSKIIIHKNNKINSLGNRIHYLGFGYCNCYGKDANCTIKEEGCETDYASGASMIVKKEVFKKIGFFREEFFMYHDDLEFCWRARLAGFKIGVAEKSICHHKYSFGSTMNLIYYMERNRIITLFSLERIWNIILILPILIPFELAMVFYMAMQGNFKAKIRSIGFLLTPTGLKLIRKIRKEVKQYRKVGDKEIVKNFAGKIEFSEIKNPILDKIANPILSIYWKFAKIFIV